MALTRAWRPADKVVLAIILLATVIYAAVFLRAGGYAQEDAAMIMRYAEHLSGGDGIVWNIGEKPVDGATDFFYLLLVAGLRTLGLSGETAVQLLGLTAHLILVALVYLANRRLHKAGQIVAVLSAAFLAVGPGLSYVRMYFGTPVFALFVGLAWYCAIQLSHERPFTKRTAACFAFFSLLAGLTRPDGVFLVGFMLLAVLMVSDGQGWKRLLGSFVLLFGLPSLVYFLWRWSYFGYPLPNPFYVKGHGGLYLDSLIAASTNLFKLTLPFILIVIPALRRIPAKRTLFLLLPVLGFTLIWILLSNEMNVLMRFQYALLPVVLMGWAALIPTSFSRKQAGQAGVDTSLTPIWRRPQTQLVLGILVAGLLIGSQVLRYGSTALYSLDGRYDVAVMLRQYRDKGYTMAVSEAGLLPLYSEWRAIDTWGLNDPWIAHNGGITAAYLDQNQPEIIMFNAYGFGTDSPERGANWDAMVTLLRNYAEQNGYTLAGVFGGYDPDAAPHWHYYYVRSGFPDSAAIIDSIEKMDYYWYLTGTISANLADQQPT